MTACAEPAEAVATDPETVVVEETARPTTPLCTTCPCGPAWVGAGGLLHGVSTATDARVSRVVVLVVGWGWGAHPAPFPRAGE